MKHILILVFIFSIAKSFASFSCNNYASGDQSSGSHALFEIKKNGKTIASVELQCSNEDSGGDLLGNKVKFIVRNKKGVVTQEFSEIQDVDYWSVSTPNLVQGLASSIIVSDAIGEPNRKFHIFQYVENKGILEKVYDGGAFSLTKMKNGEVVAYAKGGPDLWSYTFLSTKDGGVKELWIIYDKIGGSKECTYSRRDGTGKSVPLKDKLIVGKLSRYCGEGDPTKNGTTLFK